MFNFGLLTTHIPYVVLFAVYLYGISVSAEKGPLFSIAQAGKHILIDPEESLSEIPYMDSSDYSAEIRFGTPQAATGLYSPAINCTPLLFRIAKPVFTCTDVNLTCDSRAPPSGSSS